MAIVGHFVDQESKAKVLVVTKAGETADAAKARVASCYGIEPSQIVDGAPGRTAPKPVDESVDNRSAEAYERAGPRERKTSPAAPDVEKGALSREDRLNVPPAFRKPDDFTVHAAMRDRKGPHGG